MILRRNVLIYFSNEIKRDIPIRLADRLETSGSLFPGYTESMPPDLKMFQPVHAGETIYFNKSPSLF